MEWFNLVPELNGNFVLCKGEEFFSETVAFLLLPLFGQKLLDGGGTGDEGGPIAPDAVLGIGLSDCLGISDQVFSQATMKSTFGHCSLAVPQVLSPLYFRVR